MTPAAIPGRMADRHVLVTGAGTGIGRAIALRLAAEGASLSLLARDATRLAETIELARGQGFDAGAFTAKCDVRDDGAVRAAVADAIDALGPLDVVVANAGIGGANGPGFQGGDGPDRFDDLVATNLAGTYHTFRAALDAADAEAAAPRDLVAISSILARIGVVGYTGYCASKAGVGGLVRALAAELAPRGIQVNAVAPGWVDTAMAREGLDGIAAALGITGDEAHSLAMKDVPRGRMGRPEEIAGLVAWLVSDDARGVTGQMLDANGGAFML